MEPIAAKPAGTTWTDEQWEAIVRRGANVLVAAAAGSGKTAVLVERIIRRIADPSEPVDVDRLLVATFTKAAAAEMRARIRDALEQELFKQPDSDHLRRQLALLGRSSITTLHSFCLEVVQRYVQLTDLEPGFRIANDTEAALLRQDTLEDLFETLYGESPEDDAFWQTVDWFGGERSDDALFALVLRLYDASRSHPRPERWLLDMAGLFEVDDTAAKAGRLLWQQSLLGDVALELGGAAALQREALHTAEAPGGPTPYASAFAQELAQTERLSSAAAEGWLPLYDAFQALVFDRLKPVRGDEVDKTLQERAKELRDAAKKRLQQLQDELFRRSPEQLAQELRTAAPVIRSLAGIVIAFGERYRRAKAAKGLVDFADLEHYCLEVLTRRPETGDREDDGSDEADRVPSDAALAYREQFVEILLDEYQDTNRVQETIVGLISRESPGNRFMVGDVKQSIYRFRLADPGLFQQKYKSYGREGGAGRRIDLARNFRSRIEVVDAVNFVFRQIMKESVGEVAYDKSAELVYGAGYADEPDTDLSAELVLIDKVSAGLQAAQEDDDAAAETADDAAPDSLAEELREVETARLEARAVAGRIARLMGYADEPRFQVLDKKAGGRRPIAFRDIVILLRSTQNWAPLILEELRVAGIPAYAELNAGYFAAMEVETVLSLLKVIDNPYQDIPLAAVLRSPIVGLTADELARIRIVRKDGDFYRAVVAYAAQSPGGLEDRSDASGSQETARGKEIDGSDISFSQGLAKLKEMDETDATALQAKPGAWSVAAHSRSAAEQSKDVSADARSAAAQPKTAQDVPADSRSAAQQPKTAQDVSAQALSVEQQPQTVQDVPADFRSAAENSPADKLGLFLRRLERWRTEARQGSLSDLLWRILRETGYFDFVGGLPGGVQRQANLRVLYDRARQYEATAFRGLFRFLRFVERMRESGGDLGTARALGEQEDVVRIMTIHKSKGLEFPVVFIAGTGKLFNQQDLNGSFLLHKELGFGPKLFDPELRVTYPTLPLLAIRRRMRLELLAEELRVLYVALTRAREKLIIIGTVSSLDKRLRDWGRLLDSSDPELPDAELAKARSYLDWLGPAFIRHPHAKPLREAGSLGSPRGAGWLSDDRSRWSVSVITPGDLAQEAAAAAEAAPPPAELELVKSFEQVPLPFNALRAEIDRRLSWQYAHQAATRLASKTSVSEMKRLADGRIERELDEPPSAALPGVGPKFRPTPFKRPRFLERREMTAAERGTVFHSVMQHLPLGRVMDEGVISGTVAGMVERRLLAQEQADAVDAAVIVRFFETPVGRRLLNARRVMREIPFSYGLSAHEAYPFANAQAEDEPVHVQGVIDCLFEDEAGIVLLDFKTDAVRDAAPAELAARYRLQIDLYVRAVSDIWQRPVTEAYLFYFDGAVVVDMMKQK